MIQFGLAFNMAGGGSWNPFLPSADPVSGFLAIKNARQVLDVINKAAAARKSAMAAG